jgi:hypothetical protein
MPLHALYTGIGLPACGQRASQKGNSYLMYITFLGLFRHLDVAGPVHHGACTAESNQRLWARLQEGKPASCVWGSVGHCVAHTRSQTPYLSKRGTMCLIGRGPQSTCLLLTALPRAL